MDPGAVVRSGWTKRIGGLDRTLARLPAETARCLSPWVPSLFAVAIFVGGSVLLVSGATPAVAGRMAWLKAVVPLPFVEASHFLSSVVGAGLLLLAIGLSRRLDAAYVMSTILLGAGAVFSLVKGLDYEEAALLGVTLLALISARRHFYRRASIVDERFSPGWLVAVGLAVSASIVVGFFAYRHVEYSSQLWWQFSINDQAPRFLRASVGAAGVVAVGALSYLMRLAPRLATAPSAADLDAVQAILAETPDTRGWLALLGDKSLLWNEPRTSFLMYAVKGHSWVALGDPVGGTESERRELCWRFREMVDRHGGRVAFYNVGKESLPLYLDLGLTLLKLGDEARVRLSDFTLEGGARKSLRHVVHRIERGGATFRMLPAGQADLMELREVSDAWLAGKRTREKGFSLGFFDPAYVARCPVAVVRCGGRVVAFSNVWTGAPGGELSIDMMRYSTPAPANVMDYLFACLMLWGRERSYAWFHLGMAPLSGLTDHALAPIWNRVGALLYRHGADSYNFQGLRQYKEKFDPVWQPSYLACAGGFGAAGALLDVAALNSRGPSPVGET